MTTLTKKNYPSILAAFEIVSHDVGVSGPFQIPEQLSGNLPAMEEALSELSPEDLEVFCIGEQSDQTKISKRNPILEEVCDLINAHFGF